MHNRRCSSAPRLLLLGFFSLPLLCLADSADQSVPLCVGAGASQILEIRDTIVATLDQQPQLIIAREEVAKAQANVTAALTPFLPSVSASFVNEKFVPRNGSTPITVVGNQIIGGTQTYSGYGSLGLNWNLFDGGKDMAGWRGAKAGVRSSGASLHQQLAESLAGVFQAYGDLFDAQRSELEQRRTLTWLKDLQARAEERFNKGHGTTLAIEQANNKVLESERLLSQACRAIADKSAALAKAAGLNLPPGLLFGAARPPPELSDQDAGRLPDALDSWLERDPAVVAARENVAAAEFKQRQAKAAYGPTILLIGRRDYLGQSPQSLGAANDLIIPNSYRIGIEAQQPILPFTSESSALQVARTDVREAQAKYSEALIEAESRVQQAWSARQEAKSSFTAAAAAVQASQRILDLTQSVYNAGRTDLDSLQNASIDLEKAQSLQAKASADLNVANWLLLRALHPDDFPSEVAQHLNIRSDEVSGFH